MTLQSKSTQVYKVSQSLYEAATAAYHAGDPDQQKQLYALSDELLTISKKLDEMASKQETKKSDHMACDWDLDNFDPIV